MKSFLIATVFVLALAHGNFGQDAPDLQRLSQYFEEMRTKMTQDLSQILSNPELASQAQTFLEDKKAQLEPLTAQLQDQINSAAANMEEHVRPLADSVQAQMQPMVENLKKQLEDIFQRMTEQAKGLSN